MNDIVELIFAIVAGFFWLFGGSLFRKREEDPAPPTAAQKSRTSEPSSNENEQTHQQEIRDAIRRKIAERRQQSDAEPVVILKQEPYKQTFGQPDQASKPLAYEESVEEEAPEERFSWAAETSPYEKEMQQRLKELEETKRQAEALKKKLTQKTKTGRNGDSKSDAEPRETIYAGSIRSGIKDPRTLRTAFIYKEILGEPVGLHGFKQR